MRYTIEYKILTKIKKAKGGSLFFHDDFTHYGNIEAIKKALQRLANKGELTRVAHGIYVRPRKDAVLGTIFPGIEDIAKAIAKRDRARIVPTGEFALNKLGLSTQIPMNIIFLTDGAPRKIKIGNNTVSFKKASPKNVAAVGEISKLAIQAMRSIGKKNITKVEIEKIQELLRKEKPTRLEHDIRLAPVWIKEIMTSVLKEMENE